MRTRSRTLIDESKTFNGSTTDYSGGVPVNTYPVSYYGMLKKHTQSISDVVTPDYLSRQRKGEIISNPCSREDILTVWNPGSLSTSWGSTPGVNYSVRTYEGGFIEIFLASPHTSGIGLERPSCSIDDVKARVIASAHARARLSEAQVLATLGELEETVRSIASIMMRAYRIFRALKRFDVRFLKRQISPKELSDRYMEARYAIRPLYYDARQIIAAATAERPKKGSKLRFTASESFNESRHETGVVYRSDSDYIWHADRSAASSGKVRAGVLTSVEALSELTFWGCFDVIETVWELVPFSFIIDWFINVGDTIGAWTPKAGLKVLTSWVSVERTDTFIFAPKENTPVNPTNIYLNCTGVLTRTVTSYERTIAPSLPLLPRVDVNLSVAKLLDLAIIGKKMLNA